MLAFAKQQISKPFSNMGMARSLIWPRQTTGESWFCAELVAAVLKVGGLMSLDSNPGSATPHSLWKTYSKMGAATANPYTLRSVNNLGDRQSLLPISVPRSGLPPHARPLRELGRELRPAARPLHGPEQLRELRALVAQRVDVHASCA